MGPYKTAEAIDKRVERARRELSRWKIESIRHRMAAQVCEQSHISNPVAAADCFELGETIAIEVGILRHIGPPETAEKTLEIVLLIGRLERLATVVQTALTQFARSQPQA